jgi:hypothetical protein
MECLARRYPRIQASGSSAAGGGVPVAELSRVGREPRRFLSLAEGKAAGAGQFVFLEMAQDGLRSWSQGVRQALETDFLRDCLQRSMTAGAERKAAVYQAMRLTPLAGVRVLEVVK